MFEVVMISIILGGITMAFLRVSSGPCPAHPQPENEWILKLRGLFRLAIDNR